MYKIYWEAKNGSKGNGTQFYNDAKAWIDYSNDNFYLFSNIITFASTFKPIDGIGNTLG